MSEALKKQPPHKPKKKSLVVCLDCGGQLIQDMNLRLSHCRPCKKTFTWEQLFVAMFNSEK